MHIKRCMMRKCMIMKYLMHERSHKDRKNQIKDQKRKSSTIGTLPHSNKMIFWNECLVRSKMRVGRMTTEDAHRQGGKNIKNFLQQLTIFPQIQFWEGIRTLRSYMTNHTTMMASQNKLRSIQNLRLRPKWRL